MTNRPSSGPRAAWCFYGLALTAVVLALLQMTGLVIGLGDQGSAPRLLHAMAALPLGLLLVFLYIFGGIVAYFIGFLIELPTGGCLGCFYVIAFLFFSVFNALVLLPLSIYLRTGKSGFLYAFTVLVTLYASFIIASY